MFAPVPSNNMIEGGSYNQASASGVGTVEKYLVIDSACEVPRVLFLGVCLDFYYCLRRVLVPKFGFHFSWRAVAQALVKPRLVPP